jgi:hypothetical protein
MVKKIIGSVDRKKILLRRFFTAFSVDLLYILPKLNRMRQKVSYVRAVVKFL